MRYGLDIDQRVKHTHGITIETDKTEEELNRILEEFEKKAEGFMYSFDDMLAYFARQGITVVDSCVDEDGTITDVEVWVG